MCQQATQDEPTTCIRLCFLLTGTHCTGGWSTSKPRLTTLTLTLTQLLHTCDAGCDAAQARKVLHEDHCMCYKQSGRTNTEVRSGQGVLEFLRYRAVCTEGSLQLRK